MCGIFGWVRRAANADEPRDRELLRTLTSRLGHRGPDGAGQWHGTTGDAEFHIGLGHRRLSIIDLSSSASQPMEDEFGRVLIFNGEIYNYLELQQSLRAAGVQLRTKSDTEVLLRLLAKDRDGALAQLRGMFAFVYWDPLAGELLLGRDHFGKKPLYIAQLGGSEIAFSSEIEPLTRLPGLSLSVDRASLDEYLGFRYVPGPNTFFENIKKLPPGHVAVWKNGCLETRRFFVPPYQDAGDNDLPDIDADRIFGEALQDAVTVRLRSDAPFGAFLSGGIDSACVVALMSGVLSQPVSTFSVGFVESRYSELKYARLVASRFATDHHELVLPAEAIVESLPEATLRRGAPVSEPSDVAIMLLAKRASDSVKMVLTGEGSDELLGGYPKHRAELLIAQYQKLVPAGLHRLLAEPVLRALPFAGRRLAIPLRAAGERDPAARFELWFGAMSRRERDQSLASTLPLRVIDDFPLSSQSSTLKRLLFFDQTSWLPDNLLERGDRMMMAGSIEGRMPFMDVPLSHAVATFPPRLLTGGRGGKIILRRLARKLLPGEIVNRPKVGFRIPIADWFAGPLQPYVKGHLLDSSSATSRLLKRSAVERVVEEHVTGRRNHERLLWTLLTFEIFAERYQVAF